MSELDDEELAQRARSITPEDRVREQPPSELWWKVSSAIESPTGQTPPASVTPIAGARQTLKKGSPVPKILAAAAAVVAFFIAFTIFDNSDQANFITLVAEVRNDDLPVDFDGTANAVLEIDDPPILELEFSESIPSGEPVELWLGTPDLGELVSLGIVDEGATAWTGDWPAGVDPFVFSVIDLSREPDDGDPTHSGNSLLRGQLRES